MQASTGPTTLLKISFKRKDLEYRQHFSTDCLENIGKGGMYLINSV